VVRFAAVALVLLLLAVASLFLNAHLVLRRDDTIRWKHFTASLDRPDPVDRRRVLESGGSGGDRRGSVISVAHMERTRLGAESVAKWPLFWVLTAPQHENTRCEEIISSWATVVPRDSLIPWRRKESDICLWAPLCCSQCAS